jgi:LysM repeat protein
MSPLINRTSGPVAPQGPGAVANDSTAVVQLGENSLSGIANRVGVDLNDLIKANPQISNPDKLTAGQEIRLPSPGSPAMPLHGTEPAAGETAASGLPPAPLGDALLKDAVMAKLNSNVPGFSAPGLKEAVAQSRSTGLPVFHATTANALFSGASKEAHNAALTELANDPSNFLKARFTLTDQQKKNVERLTSAQTEVVRDAARLALSLGGLFGGDCGAGDVSDKLKQESAEMKKQSDPKISFTQEEALAGSVAAMKGYSAAVTIHMNGFPE